MSAHLNLKWTVADTDRILRMARKGCSVREIMADFAARRRPITSDEIKSICADQGAYCRRVRRVPA